MSRRPPACMDEREFRAWWSANLRISADEAVRSPCADCTPEWHAEMTAAKSCDGVPGQVGRPVGGRHPEATRAYWRDKARAMRARRREAAA